MSVKISMKDVEAHYKTYVADYITKGNVLAPDTVLELSLQLFQEIKVKGISIKDDPENDMLLFQYGIYDFGNNLGKHFSFDVTRQFIKNDGCILQLNFTLIYDSEFFLNCESYNIWSVDSSNLDEWLTHIKTTEGYYQSKLIDYKTYIISLTES